MRTTRTHYLNARETSRAFIVGRIAYWQSVTPFRVGRVSIKNHASIWGSCSILNNLNFNWRLLLLPPELADYVVVHELCHTVHHNHSRVFWDLVSSLVPDWRARRAALRYCHPAGVIFSARQPVTL